MEGRQEHHTIAVVDHDLEVRPYLEIALRCAGYSVELAQDREEILALITSRPAITAVLYDLAMPLQDAMETLKEIRRRNPNLPVIVVSDAPSPANIVMAMKTGAIDFLCKPLSPEDLYGAINRALEKLPELHDKSTGPFRQRCSNTAFVGMSPQMREIQDLIGDVGWSEAPVLIEGETGTGKEVIARELHASSPRANKIFLKLNCAALPTELVESELFGYERGAFTGAFQRKAGMFESADGGTIFLDEIGDMDVCLQAKLLQVLQDREFQRIGGKELIGVDVRVMAATHQDLETCIATGTFREDLYYRLNVINMRLPPLRERRGDIMQLAEHLLKKHAVSGRPAPLITPTLKHAFLTYGWPGNVREMENVLRRLIVLRNPEHLARELNARANHKPIPAESMRATKQHPGAGSDLAKSVLEEVTRSKKQLERDVIVDALNGTNWHRKQAAALLKIDYKALLYKIKKLGIEDQSKARSVTEMGSGKIAAGAVTSN